MNFNVKYSFIHSVRLPQPLLNFLTFSILWIILNVIAVKVTHPMLMVVFPLLKQCLEILERLSGNVMETNPFQLDAKQVFYQSQLPPKGFLEVFEGWGQLKGSFSDHILVVSFFSFCFGMLCFQILHAYVFVDIVGEGCGICVNYAADASEDRLNHTREY